MTVVVCPLVMVQHQETSLGPSSGPSPDSAHDYLSYPKDLKLSNFVDTEGNICLDIVDNRVCNRPGKSGDIKDCLTDCQSSGTTQQNVIFENGIVKHDTIAATQNAPNDNALYDGGDGVSSDGILEDHPNDVSDLDKPAEHQEGFTLGSLQDLACALSECNESCGDTGVSEALVQQAVSDKCAQGVATGSIECDSADCTLDSAVQSVVQSAVHSALQIAAGSADAVQECEEMSSALRNRPNVQPWWSHNKQLVNERHSQQATRSQVKILGCGESPRVGQAARVQAKMHIREERQMPLIDNASRSQTKVFLHEDKANVHLRPRKILSCEEKQSPLSAHMDKALVSQTQVFVCGEKPREACVRSQREKQDGERGSEAVHNGKARERVTRSDAGSTSATRTASKDVTTQVHMDYGSNFRRGPAALLCSNKKGGKRSHESNKRKICPECGLRKNSKIHDWSICASRIGITVKKSDKSEKKVSYGDTGVTGLFDLHELHRGCW